MQDTSAERYSRQELFAPIGAAGQARLAKARVAIVGVGALGTVSAGQLARAGVGFLRCIDRDVVDWTNLQRQVLFDERDAEAGVAKATAAAEQLRHFNSRIQVEPVTADLTSANIHTLLSDVDLIVDATDNVQVRQLLNDWAVSRSIPWIYGAAVSSYGVTCLIRPGVTPCLTCLFGEGDTGGHDTCDTVGVIAAVTGIIASAQVAEALKFLTGNQAALRDGLLYVDVWHNEWRSLPFGDRRIDCPTCGLRQFPLLEARSGSVTVTFCGRQTIQVRPQADTTVNLPHLAERLRRLGTVRANDSLLRFEVDEVQMSLFADGRALIHGVTDPAAARSFYARYVGM